MSEEPIYKLPEDPSFPASIYAQDRVILSSQFRKDVISRFIANYENFWAIGREEVGIEEMQMILDRMGATATAILLHAWDYVQGIVSAFPEDLPEKYHEAPYEYEISDEGSIILIKLKAAWLPEEQEELEDDNYSD